LTTENSTFSTQSVNAGIPNGTLGNLKRWIDLKKGRISND